MAKTVIGKNIRTLRENVNLTQSNLADFMKVDQSLISKIEKGEGGLPVDTLEKIADLFGVTVAQMELFGIWQHQRIPFPSAEAN